MACCNLWFGLLAWLLLAVIGVALMMMKGQSDAVFSDVFCTEAASLGPMLDVFGFKAHGLEKIPQYDEVAGYA